MTKPDDALIWKMVVLKQDDPALGIKSAARLALGPPPPRHSTGWKQYSRNLERLRAKFRRLRDSDRLPGQSPIATALQAEVERVAKSIPERDAALRKVHAELLQQLQALGVEVPDNEKERREQLQAFEQEEDDLRLNLLGMHTETAFRLLDKHESAEDAKRAAAEMVKRWDFLNQIIPIYRRLRHIRPLRS